VLCFSPKFLYFYLLLKHLETLNYEIIQIVLLAFILFISFSIYGQNDDVTIKVEKLSDNVFMLIGQGGNIGVSVGDDGVFVIDDQYAPLTNKIVAAIKTISDKPIEYVVFYKE